MTKIELINVSKHIRKNTVIDNVKAVFSSGTIVGFKGINGSGKTMLMRLICGLIRPSEGYIKINDKILWKDISFPESIGVLLENPSFLDHYSGMENLRMLASIKHIADDKKIEEVMRTVGLEPDDRKKYRKYSLGMKQRLGIAAAIMESPDIVILDEPTNSLDSSGVSIVKEIVTKERDRGALVILACRDFEVLKYLADEIYVLEKGRISQHTEEI